MPKIRKTNKKKAKENFYFDDCAICRFQKSMDEQGRSPTLSELKKAFEQAKKEGALVGGPLFDDASEAGAERKEMERLGFEYVGTKDDFKMPKWMDCVWRRVPCGKWSCKICGRIQQDKLQHVIKGEDPDSLESALEDAGQSFKETLAVIKADAARRGIDIANIDDIAEPPEATAFALYNRAMEWHKSVMLLAQQAELNGSPWFYTAAAADLLWYKNILCTKVYRQLCNRWHMDQGDEYGKFDYQYTKYVLGECFKILKKALAELITIGATQASGLNLALTTLATLEKEIVDI